MTVGCLLMRVICAGARTGLRLAVGIKRGAEWLLRWTAVIERRLAGREPPKALILAAVEQRFGSDAAPPRPIEWLTDNGSCYTVRETRAYARTINMRPITTPMESQQSNGIAESFVKTIKRAYVAFGDLSDTKAVMAQLPNWFSHCNTVHPHSALKYMSPGMFR
jgi:transposase InsO family protein